MKIYIETLKQARRELAKTYHEYKTKTLDSEQSKTRVYILRAIVEANYKYDIERRLEELEAKVNIGGGFN